MKKPSLPYLETRTRQTKAGPATYWYFRRGKGAMIRLPDPDDEGFLAAYAEAKRGAPKPTRTSIRALIQSYKASPQWSKLSPRSKADYAGVLGHIDAVAGEHDVSKITRPGVIKARDKVGGRKGNYIAQLYSVLCEHAIDLGWLKMNPAKGVKMTALGDGYGPWPDWAIAAYRAKATGRALLIFELCYWTGQRIADVMKMRWDAIAVEDGAEAIVLRQGKAGRAGKRADELWIPILPGLRAVLDATPKTGLTIIAQSNSRPLSDRQASYAVEAVRKAIGATEFKLHGLRANAASELYEAGCTDAQVQAVTGHKSVVMARKYGRGARQKTLAKAAMEKRGGS